MRAAGTALAAALLLGLTPSVADATPRRPTDGEIASARAQADAVAARIGALNGQLAGAEAAVDAARAEALIALDEFQATEAAAEAARGHAEAASAKAAAAAEELGGARADVVAFARRTYMEGSTNPGAAALLTSGSPAQMIERAALLEAAGAHRSDVLVKVTVLQQEAAAAEVVARAASAEAEALQQQAQASLEVARTAEVSARQQQAELVEQQATVQAELATAQQQLTTLVGERAAADRASAARAAAVAPPPPPAPAPAPAPGGPSGGAGNTSPAGPGSSSKAQVAIDAAMAYIGTPYAWGGGGRRGPGPGQAPDQGVIGFDCSGLTQYAYGQAGISIPRNSRAQYAALPKVDRAALKPGDLVFWATDPSRPSTIHHVAIWLGGDRILEAPESGSFVRATGMRWGGYAGAVRPSA
ncbi:C40 family peptidase [Blastococcus sp. CCUG 61487]|uniref:C40 family peptidase n=1 Tax=Blastococcus sp. CCUG 61487 TaxID=1840703 RepID=UPI00113F5B8E|nr:C40 family peptidase [Blastococcus sp. CCUG 61487]TKJ30276.1 hypothetical protein A6V29_18910 [Blastococcus sp. CCUG 61487]